MNESKIGQQVEAETVPLDKAIAEKVWNNITRMLDQIEADLKENLEKETKVHAMYSTANTPVAKAAGE
jgi:hypothetical protein